MYSLAVKERASGQLVHDGVVILASHRLIESPENRSQRPVSLYLVLEHGVERCEMLVLAVVFAPCLVVVACPFAHPV